MNQFLVGHTVQGHPAHANTWDTEESNAREARHNAHLTCLGPNSKNTRNPMMCKRVEALLLL